MKKFIFTLDKVLNLKKQLLDVMTNELIMLNVELKQIEEEIENLNKLYAERDAQMVEELKAGVSPEKIMSYKNFFKSLYLNQNGLSKKKSDCENRIYNKKEELIQLKSEISGYEKLKEKQKSEYQKALQKMDELLIEEFVNKSTIAQ